MDDWHRKLVQELVGGTPAGFVPDAAAALEIAFGKARSAVTYTLELARAHRIPAAGNVTGDDIWLQLASGRVRFTLNRREAYVVVQRQGQDELRVRADAGAPDLGAIAREAIDALVTSWRQLPASDRRPSAPPPEFEDEPTKG
jgi:hypothetical protein